MDFTFYKDALFDGMTSNAFKLGTTLTVGWFWPRLTGCSLLYRGESIYTVDFERILAVENFDTAEIRPPSYLPHQNNTTYFYILRRVNSCGDIECTLSAAVKVIIDAEGNLAGAEPNSIFVIRPEVVDGSKVRLVWFYCKLNQKSRPVRFNIYTDSATGMVDYQNPIARIQYEGIRFYSFTTQELSPGRYLFTVRAQNENGLEGSSLKTTLVELKDKDVPQPNLYQTTN